MDNLKKVKVRYWISIRTPRRWRRGYHTLEEAKKAKDNVGVISNPFIKNCQQYKDYVMEIGDCKITKITEIKEEIN